MQSPPFKIIEDNERVLDETAMNLVGEMGIGSTFTKFYDSLVEMRIPFEELVHLTQENETTFNYVISTVTDKDFELISIQGQIEFQEDKIVISSGLFIRRVVDENTLWIYIGTQVRKDEDGYHKYSFRPNEEFKSSWEQYYESNEEVVDGLQVIG